MKTILQKYPELFVLAALFLGSAAFADQGRFSVGDKVLHLADSDCHQAEVTGIDRGTGRIEYAGLGCSGSAALENLRRKISPPPGSALNSGDKAYIEIVWNCRDVELEDFYEGGYVTYHNSVCLDVAPMSIVHKKIDGRSAYGFRVGDKVIVTSDRSCRNADIVSFYEGRFAQYAGDDCGGHASAGDLRIPPPENRGQDPADIGNEAWNTWTTLDGAR